MKQLCTFSVGDFEFGVDMRDVQEVLLFQEITPVPLAPSAVAGLINLRGHIVSVVDLRRSLQLPERQPESLPINVIIRNPAGDVMSVLVDSIGDVVDVNEAAVEAPPPNLDPALRRYVRAICKFSEGLVLVLETKAIDVDENRAAA